MTALSELCDNGMVRNTSLMGTKMFRITDNNGWTLIRGSEKACRAFVKKQLAFQYEPMSLDEFDGYDWFSLGRMA